MVIWEVETKDEKRIVPGYCFSGVEQSLAAVDTCIPKHFSVVVERAARIVAESANIAVLQHLLKKPLN